MDRREGRLYSMIVRLWRTTCRNDKAFTVISRLPHPDFEARQESVRALGQRSITVQEVHSLNPVIVLALVALAG